ISFIDLAPTMLSLLKLPIPDYMQGQAFLGEQKSAEPRKYIYAARDRMDPATETIRAVRDKNFKYIKNYRSDEPWIKFLPYRDQMELMQELLRIGKERGESLPASQKWIVAQNKPQEELYDTRADPYEINNLAGDPQYRDKLLELRKEHETWRNETHDLGYMAEPDMIKKLWPPDGIQPVTEIPQTEKLNEEEGGLTISLYSNTEGASIAYRTATTAHWSVYANPLTLSKGTKLYARAIRLGYKDSEGLQFSN